jgi:hypothetical protein
MQYALIVYDVHPILALMSEGPLASRRAARQALGAPHRGCLRATNERDEALWPASAVLDGDNGQAAAPRGLRFRTAPQFLAASLSRNKPARMRALLLVRSVWWLVYAA